MIISQAEIRLGDTSYPDAPFPTALMMDNDGDKIVDCIIVGGAIVARKDIWFTQCHILRKKPTILGEIPPPGDCPTVHACRIIETILPDAYYSGCYFKEK